MNGTLIKIFDSLLETEKYGFNQDNIIKCCKGLKTSYKNFIWKYTQNES